MLATFRRCNFHRNSQKYSKCYLLSLTECLWEFHCGILINMPFCMSFLIYKPHPYCSSLTVTGASHVTTSNSFCGSRAWSEPCVDNMRGALESLKSRLKVYMTLHSYGQMWFVPYAWSRVAFPQDYQNLVSVEFSSLGYQFKLKTIRILWVWSSHHWVTSLMSGISQQVRQIIRACWLCIYLYRQ